MRYHYYYKEERDQSQLREISEQDFDVDGKKNYQVVARIVPLFKILQLDCPAVQIVVSIQLLLPIKLNPVKLNNNPKTLRHSSCKRAEKKGKADEPRSSSIYRSIGGKSTSSFASITLNSTNRRSIVGGRTVSRSTLRTFSVNKSVSNRTRQHVRTLVPN